MPVIICKVNRGVEHAFSCPCCGIESDSIDSFATSMCWDCVPGNPHCARCRKAGVPVDRFSSRRGKLHRMQTWTPAGDALTSCGLRIPYDDMGQATAVRQQCQ